jgi:uncharacterized protein YacL
VEIDPDEGDREEPVDSRLLTLATRVSGRIVTNDLGLLKRARLQGVQVVSIHELADAMKAEVVPGETLRVKIIRPGDEEGQGVGFLADGTMVVVEGARNRIGREIPIEVTSAIQTSAGRMIFGKPRAGRPRRRGKRGSGGGGESDASRAGESRPVGRVRRVGSGGE